MITDYILDEIDEIYTYYKLIGFESINVAFSYVVDVFNLLNNNGLLVEQYTLPDSDIFFNDDTECNNMWLYQKPDYNIRDYIYDDCMPIKYHKITMYNVYLTSLFLHDKKSNYKFYTQKLNTNILNLYENCRCHLISRKSLRIFFNLFCIYLLSLTKINQPSLDNLNFKITKLSVDDTMFKYFNTSNIHRHLQNYLFNMLKMIFNKHNIYYYIYNHDEIFIEHNTSYNIDIDTILLNESVIGFTSDEVIGNFVNKYRIHSKTGKKILIHPSIYKTNDIFEQHYVI